MEILFSHDIKPLAHEDWTLRGKRASIYVSYVVYIKLTTDTQEQIKLKQFKGSNKQLCDRFNHVLIPYHDILSPFPFIDFFSIYEWINYDQQHMNYTLATMPHKCYTNCSSNISQYVE